MSGLFKKIDSVEKPEFESVSEGREQIKRKYGEYGSIRVNETAPIRNEIVRFVGKRFVTEEEMKAFLTKLSEDRGKEFDGRQWFSRNGKYFEKFENRGQHVWTLSKFGKRVLEFLHRVEQKNSINENKTVALFKFDSESEVFEGIRRTADEVNREAESRIKDQIARYSELMKTNPEKADVYKAQLELAHARLGVLAAKKKLEQVKK
jgi:hypothetical protein